MIFLKFDKCKMLRDIQGKGQVASWIYKSGIQSGSPGQIQSFGVIRLKVTFNAMEVEREEVLSL